MHRIIPLWPGEAPYTADSPDRFQPSVKEFRVEGSRGAVIVCPGGGYHVKCDYEGDPISEMINEAGISAYTLDYRVMPCHPEAPLADALRAVRVVRSLGYEKVGILGFSAGGHLSCTAATLFTPADPEAEDPIERLSCRPDAFVPCYAVVDLLWRSQCRPDERLMGIDPENTVLRLSSEVYGSTSIAALGVAAHEAGHAIQDAQDYAPLRIRANLVPVANIGSGMAIPLFMLGLFMSWEPLTKIGIFAFAFSVLFYVVTLPVEFNASRRAVTVLAFGYLPQDEVKGVKAVLSAAALTYVAAALQAVLQLLRLVLLANRRHDD